MSIDSGKQERITRQRDQIVNLSLATAFARSRKVTDSEIREFTVQAGYSSDFSDAEVSEIVNEINTKYDSQS